MTIDEARNYLSYGIKNGFIHTDLEDMTDEELIGFAEKLSSDGDSAYDSWKEEHGTL